MTCERTIELMIDVLYGEEDRPRVCFDFFEHLGQCSKCRQEYIELVETREILAEWEPEEMVGSAIPQTSSGRLKFQASVNWGQWLQKVAATVLIAFGAFAVLQAIGILPARDSITVSEAQLTEVIHDVTLARQVEDWHEIGKALLNLKEEMEAKNRIEMRAVYENMENLERGFVQALEENNRNVKVLMKQ
jgi:predicted anti-sigma-YlaC factor YlaD